MLFSRLLFAKCQRSCRIIRSVSKVSCGKCVPRVNKSLTVVNNVLTFCYCLQATKNFFCSVIFTFFFVTYNFNLGVSFNTQAHLKQKKSLWNKNFHKKWQLNLRFISISWRHLLVPSLSHIWTDKFATRTIIPGSVTVRCSFLHIQEILPKLNICQKVGYIPLRIFFAYYILTVRKKIVLFSMSHFSFQDLFPLFWKEEQGFSLIKIQISKQRLLFQ